MQTTGMIEIAIKLVTIRYVFMERLFADIIAKMANKTIIITSSATNINRLPRIPQPSLNFAAKSFKEFSNSSILD
ncbi:MAG: hypothetical protein CMM93_06785 [Rickettsiales bacterium]|nr:hypothetical protein [Rickettsiales bacterium]